MRWQATAGNRRSGEAFSQDAQEDRLRHRSDPGRRRCGARNSDGALHVIHHHPSRERAARRTSCSHRERLHQGNVAKHPGSLPKGEEAHDRLDCRAIKGPAHERFFGADAKLARAHIKGKWYFTEQPELPPYPAPARPGGRPPKRGLPGRSICPNSVILHGSRSFRSCRTRAPLSRSKSDVVPSAPDWFSRLSCSKTRPYKASSDGSKTPASTALRRIGIGGQASYFNKIARQVARSFSTAPRHDSWRRPQAHEERNGREL